ncbi:MAG: hypothetical protein ACFFC7_04245 [Candidatus Hermodarchaeota archaeon]
MKTWFLAFSIFLELLSFIYIAQNLIDVLLQLKQEDSQRKSPVYGRSPKDLQVVPTPEREPQWFTKGSPKTHYTLQRLAPARRYFCPILLLWSRCAYFPTRLNLSSSPIQFQTVYPQFIVCP